MGVHTRKNVVDTILEVCPLVSGLLGRKYGRFWSSHGSPAPPQSYPLITPGLLASRRSTNSQNVWVGSTSVKVYSVAGIVSVKPAALDTILVSWPRVAPLPGRKYGLSWSSHGSLGPPQSYPAMTSRLERRSTHSQKVEP